LLVAASLALFKGEDFLGYLFWLTVILDDLVFDKLMFYKELVEFSASIGHNFEKVGCDETLVSNCSIPHVFSNLTWYTLCPEISDFGS